MADLDKSIEMIDSILSNTTYERLKQMLEDFTTEESKEPTYEEYLNTFESEYDRFYTAYPHGIDEEASES